MGEMAMKYIDGGARQVVGIDISEKYVRDAERQLTGLAINRELFEFRVMDAHELHFSDNTFDFVIGRGILHHLDLDTAIREIHRVLKPGGRASFLEPLADNPLLRIFRALTPRARTEDERPLSSRELMIIAQHFQCSNYFFGSISAPVAVLTSLIIPSRPDNFLSKLAHAAEEILRKRRILESWNQYVLLNLKRIV
jgi:ubiquinone/menaquinone biosynthesis C-methylase UbiE